MPTAWVMDPSREPMIALKMNDEPLPPIHGYPARLIVPGLYGYVSATKWLKELELTTLEGVRRLLGPPRLVQGGADPDAVADRHAAWRVVAAGQVAIAGVAWAPDRGISRVEVAVDGVWRDARLSTPMSDTTWVQWVTEMGGDARPAHDRGPRDRRDRRRPDRPAVAAGSRRRPRLPHDRRRGRLTVDRRFGIESEAWLDDAISSIPRSVSWPALSASPGDRTFFLQARDGPRVVSIVLEKAQVAVLAERLGDLLDELDAPRRRGGRRGRARSSDDAAPLDEPLNEAFRAGSLTLGWDVDDELVLVEARAQAEDGEPIDPDEDDDEDEDGPDLLRVRMTAAAARSFVARAARVVAAGRPPCPLCGAPLDPQGHICPRRNGHYVN